MRHVLWLLAALSALAVWTAPANAEPPSAALNLYAAGEYAAAADIAQRESHSAESLAFAARAALAACVVDGEDEAMLQQAERSARAALALNPDSVDARLQLAVVYGMRGRRASLAEAFARNYAPRGRRLIDEALALAPDSAEAEAVLGAWHLEIIRRSGRVGAIAYGARVEEGIAAFERARAPLGLAVGGLFDGVLDGFLGLTRVVGLGLLDDLVGEVGVVGEGGHRMAPFGEGSVSGAGAAAARSS